MPSPFDAIAVADLDIANARYKAEKRETFAVVGGLLGEILFYDERRRAGWPLMPKMENPHG